MVNYSCTIQTVYYNILYVQCRINSIRKKLNVFDVVVINVLISCIPYHSSLQGNSLNL